MIDETSQQDNAKGCKSHRNNYVNFPTKLAKDHGLVAAAVWGYVEGWEWSTKAGEDMVSLNGGHSRIADDLGLSVSTVQRAIVTLRKAGFLYTEQALQGSRYKTTHVGQIDRHHVGQIDRDIITPVITPEENPATQSSLLREKSKRVSSGSATHDPRDLASDQATPDHRLDSREQATPKVQEPPLPEGNFSMTSQEEINRDCDELFGPPAQATPSVRETQPLPEESFLPTSEPVTDGPSKPLPLAQAPPEIQVEPATTTEPEVSDAVIEAQKRLDRAKGVTGRRYAKSKPRISLTPEMQLDIANRFSPEAIARRQAEKNATIFSGNPMLSH